MIKKWFKRALAKEKDYDGMRRHKIPLLIANRAVEKVLNTLHQAGFEAYVVGGAVRDLLLGHKPKDFDVATNATPEQVNKLLSMGELCETMHMGRLHKMHNGEISLVMLYTTMCNGKKLLIFIMVWTTFMQSDW